MNKPINHHYRVISALWPGLCLSRCWMKQGLCNTRCKMWTTQETSEDEEPGTLHTFEPGSLSSLPAPNIAFLSFLRVFPFDLGFFFKSYQDYVASADDLWWFFFSFFPLRAGECVNACQQMSVSKVCGNAQDVCAKHCCQRYRATVEERLRCPPCGANFPSGSKVTQLWFDIVCECIWCVYVSVCVCVCVCVCVRVCVWERERKKEKEREGYKVEQESLCMYIACSLFFVCQLVCLCTQAFLGDYMIAFQDWHAFLRSVWGLPVSWNIPLILRSRKCFMTVGTDVAPLRPVCKVWEERAGCYQNQNAPRQHSVAFVSWVRKSPSHQQCSMKVSQQQLVGFSHMGNHLNGLYTWGKKKTKKHVFLLTASGS